MLDVVVKLVVVDSVVVLLLLQSEIYAYVCHPELFWVRMTLSRFDARTQREGRVGSGFGTMLNHEHFSEPTCKHRSAHSSTVSRSNFSPGGLNTSRFKALTSSIGCAKLRREPPGQRMVVVVTVVDVAVVFVPVVMVAVVPVTVVLVVSVTVVAVAVVAVAVVPVAVVVVLSPQRSPSNPGGQSQTTPKNVGG